MWMRMHARMHRWVLAKEIHEYFNNTATKRKEEGQKLLNEVE